MSLSRQSSTSSLAFSDTASTILSGEFSYSLPSTPRHIESPEVDHPRAPDLIDTGLSAPESTTVRVSTDSRDPATYQHTSTGPGTNLDLTVQIVRNPGTIFHTVTPVQVNDLLQGDHRTRGQHVAALLESRNYPVPDVVFTRPHHSDRILRYIRNLDTFIQSAIDESQVQRRRR